jgi:hypothetical protein
VPRLTRRTPTASNSAAEEEDVRAYVDHQFGQPGPGRGRTAGAHPGGLLGGVEQRAVGCRGVLDVHTDHAGLDDRLDGFGHVLAAFAVAALDIGGHRNVDHGHDAPDRLDHLRSTQPLSVGPAQRPGHPTAGGGDRLRARPVSHSGTTVAPGSDALDDSTAGRAGLFAAIYLSPVSRWASRGKTRAA